MKSLQFIRDENCDACRLHTEADGRDRCVVGRGPMDANIVVVSKIPGGTRQQNELNEYLAAAGLDPQHIVFTSALKCRTWNLEPSKTDMKACRQYLDAELNAVRPQWILALGNEALFATTGKSGITKYRSNMYPHPCGATVIPTIAPASVARNPGQRAGFVADIKYFADKALGKSNDDVYLYPGDRYYEVWDKPALKRMCATLAACDTFSIDIETTGPTESDTDARIVSLAVTCRRGNDMTSSSAWAVPLYHPDSPFAASWERVLDVIGRIIANVPIDGRRVIAQNGKFDLRWLRFFSPIWDLVILTFDTILARSLLNENEPKGLKPMAVQLLGCEPWGIDTRDLLTTPMTDILPYNMLDTWHALRVSDVLRKQLVKQPRLARIFKLLMMPASEALIGAESRGIWVDEKQLAYNRRAANETQAAIEREITDMYVPPRDVWPPKITDINFNRSNFALWWLFDHWNFPVLARGKEKPNGDPGDPSMAEAYMTTFAELDDTRGDIAKLLIQRNDWNKKETSFFGPYTEQVDVHSRIHTNFKLHGTVTGRLSSGKADTEKITSRKQYRGVNMQQVPRDPLVRGVFGAPPGYWFVQADYSQVELRVVAFVARERNMLHHYNTGQDLHMAMAMRMTGKPKNQVTKEERKSAKPVNFGFVYGMNWRKFILTAWEQYGVRFTESQARAARRAFFDLWPDLPRWHAKQIRLAHKYGRVESPLGRVRHLPDIYSPDDGVRAEAERQAINSPIQALASDMALLALVLLDAEFKRRGLDAHVIGTVHDAVNFEIADADMAEALPLIKDTMENLPLRRKFGVVLDVPIVADISVGARWGGANELTAEQVYDWKPEYGKAAA